MIEQANQQIEKDVRDILKQVGDDPERAGVLETPQRVAKMYGEVLAYQGETIFKDYKLFETEETDDDQMVMMQDIPFYSMCEHHMLPFFGQVSVAYLPANGQIIGLSKIPRLVDFVSKRLSVQENLTRDIGQVLNQILKPHGVAVQVTARHMCVEMRGIKKANSQTHTTFYSGNFKTDRQLRSEFLQLLK